MKVVIIYPCVSGCGSTYMCLTAMICLPRLGNNQKHTQSAVQESGGKVKYSLALRGFREVSHYLHFLTPKKEYVNVFHLECE